MCIWWCTKCCCFCFPSSTAFTNVSFSPTKGMTPVMTLAGSLCDQCPYEPCFCFISSSSAWFDALFPFFLHSIYTVFFSISANISFPALTEKALIDCTFRLYLSSDCTSGICSFFIHGLGRNCVRHYQSFPLLCDEV